VRVRTGSIVRLLLGLSAVFAIPVWAQEGNPERNAYFGEREVIRPWPRVWHLQLSAFATL
jgi:hypothetical protein